MSAFVAGIIAGSWGTLIYTNHSFQSGYNQRTAEQFSNSRPYGLLHVESVTPNGITFQPLNPDLTIDGNVKTFHPCPGNVITLLPGDFVKNMLIEALPKCDNFAGANGYRIWRDGNSNRVNQTSINLATTTKESEGD